MVHTTILAQAWEKVYGVNITAAANGGTYSPEQLGNQLTAEANSVNRIGFIGLGAMGFGMATQLLKSNFCVLGYDVLFLLHSFDSSLLHGKWKLKYSGSGSLGHSLCVVSYGTSLSNYVWMLFLLGIGMRSSEVQSSKKQSH